MICRKCRGRMVGKHNLFYPSLVERTCEICGYTTVHSVRRKRAQSVRKRNRSRNI